MKRNFTVRLPKACTEDWEAFVPKENGRLCQACNKVVVDFTRMSNNEIVTYLSTHEERICARLGQHQLKTYSLGTEVTVRPGFGLLKAGIFSLLLLLTTRPSQANLLDGDRIVLTSPKDAIREPVTSFTLEGQVIAKEDGSPLPGVNVVIKGTSNGTVTDADGHFRIGPLQEGYTIVISFIGYETAEYVVEDGRDSNLVIRLSPDLEMLNEVVITGELNIEEVWSSDSAGNASLWRKFKSVFKREPKNQ